MPQYAGEIVISDPDKDKPLLVLGTIQCGHCGCHWVPQPGSGKVRGICGKCHQPVCSRECGERCIPQEKLMEIIEGTVNPTAVSVSRGGIILPGGE